MKLLEIIAKNLKALEAYNKMNQTSFAKHCDLHQRTYNRIVNMESMAKLDMLEQIANKNGLQVWQLLIEGFEPTNPPIIKVASDQEKEFYDKIKSAAKELAKYQ